jgi:hypothetical protein
MDKPAIKDRVRTEYIRNCDWSKINSDKYIRFHPVLIPDLPHKHAGAGLARKIGMDTALDRFGRLGKPEGWILSLDADTLVEGNYFTEIDRATALEPDAGGCILNFAHPVDGNEFDQKIYDAIVQYELHLRYYKHILDSTGFPWSNYTIGSCFGVKAGIYALHGGMNRQQAGEDFYFLNKLFPHVQFLEVLKTCVFPSPRISDRVPFGTGPVIRKLITGQQSEYLSYHPSAFKALEQWFKIVRDLYDIERKKQISVFDKLPETVKDYLEENDYVNRLAEIRKNTSNPESFEKRFFLWFDGFRVVKYLNFTHERYYKKIPVRNAAADFLKEKGVLKANASAREILEIFRKMDTKCDF